MKNEITFIDPFAGIGGIRLGLEKANQIGTNTQQGLGDKEGQSVSRTQRGRRRKLQEFHCVWSNEWDEYCAEIYQKNFGEAPDTRDIRTVPSGEIPDHDLLCAGFPCQSFSIAGKRAGFEDTRGTLFFEIARILRDKRPRHLLLENVKGLLSHQAGQTFQTILGVLSGLGYRCEWQVLNSKYFGVPQNRERVFIVGHLGGEGGSQVFPIEQRPEISLRKNEETPSRNKVATALTKDYHKAPLNRGEGYVIHDKRQAGEFRLQKQPSVTKHYGTGGGNVPLVIGNIYPSKGQAGQILDTKGLSKAIVPAKRGGSAVMPIVYHQNKSGQVTPHEQAQALRAGASHSYQTVANAVDCDGYLRQMGVHHDKPIGHYRIRRLTPTECERLQGFPDGWTEGVSNTQRYRMLGNAVTVNVVEAIGERMRKVLNEG